MKLQKSKTTIQLPNGVHVEHGGWQTVSYNVIKCEYSVINPDSRFMEFYIHEFNGLFEILIKEGRAHSLRIIVCPKDIYDADRPRYESINLTFAVISGEYYDSDVPIVFRDSVFPEIIFKKYHGWEVIMKPGIEQLVLRGERAFVKDVESMLANILCTERFMIDIGEYHGSIGSDNVHRYQNKTVGTCITLSNITGLRASLADLTGAEYVKKLLRKKGYELD